MDEARCGVTSQLVNGCAAHASRRLLTRHLKTCLLVTLFTTTWLGSVDPSTDGFQVSVELAIIEGA